MKCDCEERTNKVTKLLLEALYQACGDGNEIDTCFISVYTESCTYLEERGYLQKLNDRRYKILRE